MGIDLDGVELALGPFRLKASATFAAGEVTALIGPSGAGKSTLLSAIAGFIDPSAGTIRINGVDMSAKAPGRRPVTMLFQDHNLFPHLSVTANVGLGLRPDLRLSAEDRQQVAAVIARVGLTGHGDKLPTNLSGGQIGRVALARALLRNRPVLLLDEPFSALGPALRHEMLDLVSAVQRERKLTVLLVTHLPGDARRIARFSSLVADGVVAKPHPTSELLANPPKALRDYLG